MPTISKQWVLKPRKRYVCAACDLHITGPHWVLFGYAEPGDTPYRIRVHTLDRRGCGAAGGGEL